MLIRDILLKELEHVSEPILAEVVDFVRFLKSKAPEENQQPVTNNSRNNWLRPGEDAAWANLYKWVSASYSFRPR